MTDAARRKSKIFDVLKNLLLFSLLVGVIIVSFWVSFLLGKRILVPVKRIPGPRIEVAIPEPPPEIAELQKLGIVAKEIQTTTASTIVKRVVKKVIPKQRPIASSVKHYYKVQAGSYIDKERAKALAKKLNENGIETYIKKVGTGWKVQVGAFNRKSQAQDMQRALKAKGFDSALVYE